MRGSIILTKLLRWQHCNRLILSYYLLLSVPVPPTAVRVQVLSSVVRQKRHVPWVRRPTSSLPLPCPPPFVHQHTPLFEKDYSKLKKSTVVQKDFEELVTTLNVLEGNGMFCPNYFTGQHRAKWHPKFLTVIAEVLQHLMVLEVQPGPQGLHESSVGLF